MKKKDFCCFLKHLIKAIENIDTYYFQLPISKDDEPIYRERVYCYELYHQLRCMLGDDFPYKLNGEVDKSGHPIIKGSKKPDFIVHQPGNMENNLVVIEVKPVTVEQNLNKLSKDLKNLKWFLEEAGYFKAIMLIYGNVNDNLPNNIKQKIKNNNVSGIMVLWHSKPYEKPKIIK
jgi:hypothetical protein